MPPAVPTVFLEQDLFGGRTLVLHGRVVAASARLALEGKNNPVSGGHVGSLSGRKRALAIASPVPSRKTASKKKRPRRQMAPRSLKSFDYARILVTMPAPTVRPPSRMANFTPSSMAIVL